MLRTCRQKSVKITHEVVVNRITSLSFKCLIVSIYEFVLHLSYIFRSDNTDTQIEVHIFVKVQLSIENVFALNSNTRYHVSHVLDNNKSHINFLFTSQKIGSVRFSLLVHSLVRFLPEFLQRKLAENGQQFVSVFLIY